MCWQCCEENWKRSWAERLHHKIEEETRKKESKREREVDSNLTPSLIFLFQSLIRPNLYIYISIYIMGCVNGHRTVPVNHIIFLLFPDTIFVFFCNSCHFFTFVVTIQNFFLSFLHLTSTKRCWLTFSIFFIINGAQVVSCR